MATARLHMAPEVPFPLALHGSLPPLPVGLRGPSDMNSFKGLPWWSSG